MPKDCLPVPHFEQSANGQCLPACARMVLAYLLFVQAGELPYSESEGFHAVVVVGVSEQVAHIHDPALDTGPQSVPLDYLQLAWSEFEYKGAVITS